MLDSMFIDSFADSYIIVRDPWHGGLSIPVYANAHVERWWTVEVTGTMATISGVRVVIASRIRVYADSKLRPCPPYPKGLEAPWRWPFMLEVPQGEQDREIPPPPEGRLLLLGSPPVRSPVSGTIAYAKYHGGATTLTGKIVTGVFEDSSHALDFFYIQEPDDSDYRPMGIRVEAPMGAPCVEIGDIVTVTGSVVSDAECHIVATEVLITGEDTLPVTVGMPNRSTASGEFGLQPALYRSATEAGTGMNAVGSRVRAWGMVTSRPDDHTCYIDDGSELTGDASPGLRVMYYWQTAPAVNQYVGVTGVLGAEENDELPVPVIRVTPTYEQPTGCIIKVAGDWGNDQNDGSTWRCAKKTICAAVQAAQEGCEIWVAAAPVQGGYEEGVSINVDLGLYGGFFGWELRRCEREPEANETVLHGGEKALRGVTVCAGLTSATVVDGFTITDYADGAVKCADSSPVISGNKITANHTTAIECTGVGETPLIENNAVTANAVGALIAYGGGLYSDCASPVIKGNVFEGNEASDLGGAIYCYQGSATISGNTFTDNLITSFGAGGAIACVECDAQVLIDRNVFEGNGGPFCNHGGAITVEECHSATISNSLFVGNHARGSYFSGGGAIHARETPYSSGGPPLLIRNNTFVENWLVLEGDPPQPNSFGGAIHVRERPGTVVNNVFSENIAAYGFGVAATGGASVTVSHCDAYTGDGSANYYSDQASTLTWTGLSNLFTDPDFCLSGTAHPYWLDQNSPLRGAGDPNVVPVGDLDLDGRPRPGPDGVDIGAYEDNPQCQ